MLSRTARRFASSKSPRGPRGILRKAQTPSSRITPRSSNNSTPSSSNNATPSSSNNATPASSNNSPLNHTHPSTPPQENNQQPPSKNALIAAALAENPSSNLIAPVTIPHDPHGVLTPSHPAWDLLNNSSLVIQRQLEMMNVFLGFEQANKYIIMNGKGESIGYMAEQDHGLGSTMARQAFKTHRSFTCHIFDQNEREILRIHRPFSWISSRIRVYDASSREGYTASDSLQGTSLQSAAHISPLALEEMPIIGEAQQQWAPLRRKYNLFNHRTPTTTTTDSTPTPTLTSGQEHISSTALTTTTDQQIQASMHQFAHVDEPFLSWDFTLRDASSKKIGSVNRNFGGFARELFTDTGVYALRMDSVALSGDEEEKETETEQARAMTLDQRAVMLATAVCIDFDYFSRHSSAGGGIGGFMPLWFPGMGGGAAAEGGAVGAAGEAGVAGEMGGIARGGAGAGVGVSEGAIAGAGTMAGMEAMNRSGGGGGGGGGGAPSQTQSPIDDASPQAGGDPFLDGQDVWAEESQDPWAQQQQENDPWNQQSNGGGSSGGGNGEGGGFDWGDWF